MKRLRFLSGEGNGNAIIPGGQVLQITMVPGAAGSWLQIAESKPVWVPSDITLDLRAADIGLCCGDGNCDRWPGDVQIQIIFGQGVSPAPGPGEVVIHGSEPRAWLVIYNSV